MKEFAILDIKEKYGRLVIYTNGVSPEVDRVLKKYEYISQFVCVTCGEDAVKQTLGWICPYCEDCKPDNQLYVHFGHNGFKYYGWEGNVWHIPNEEWDKEEKLLEDRNKWG